PFPIDAEHRIRIQDHFDVGPTEAVRRARPVNRPGLDRTRVRASAIGRWSRKLEDQSSIDAHCAANDIRSNALVGLIAKRPCSSAIPGIEPDRDARLRSFL